MGDGNAAEQLPVANAAHGKNARALTTKRCSCSGGGGEEEEEEMMMAELLKRTDAHASPSMYSTLYITLATRLSLAPARVRVRYRYRRAHAPPIPLASSPRHSPTLSYSQRSRNTATTRSYQPRGFTASPPRPIPAPDVFSCTSI